MAAGSGHHDTARLWLIRTDLPEDVLSRLAALLDEHERQRLEAIRDDVSRRRFTAAHGITRLVVGHHSGAPPEAVRWRRGAHGKPELAWPRAPLHVNLSHSGDLALVAVSAHRPVGVDVEVVPRSVDAGRLAARYYPGVEADLVARAGGPADQLDRFIHLWVRKEACVKAAGARLLRGLRLPVVGTGATVLVRDPTGVLPGPYLVRDLVVPPGFRAAVALAGGRSFRVVRRWWSAESLPGSQPGSQPGHAPRINRPVLARNTSSRLGR